VLKIAKIPELTDLDLICKQCNLPIMSQRVKELIQLEVALGINYDFYYFNEDCLVHTRFERTLFTTSFEHNNVLYSMSKDIVPHKVQEKIQTMTKIEVDPIWELAVLASDQEVSKEELRREFILHVVAYNNLE